MCVCVCAYLHQCRVLICVLLKPSVLKGKAIYYYSGEDNHVLLLCLYPLTFISAQQKSEAADCVLEILYRACYAV